MRTAVNCWFAVFLLLMGPGFSFASSDADNFEPFAVVELFTSEGCSSCPPADKLLSALVKRSREKDLRIFPLSFHVSYWNYIGWEDPFSSEANSERQKEYSRVLKSDSVYTPQMVVNGKYGFGGFRDDLLQNYLDRVLVKVPVSSIALSVAHSAEGQIELAYEISGAAEGNLAFALVERGLSVDVSGGENAGKKLRHDNVVRFFQSFPVENRSGTFSVPVPSGVNIQNASVIAYLQNARTMAILAAEQVDIK